MKLFPTLYGNELSKKRIANMLSARRMPHAFLIDGPEGSGKLTYARLIASALNCTAQNPEALPCGECNNCRRILSDGFVDVRILRKSSDKATLGVAEVKQFKDDLYMSPTESDYKVYIIDDAEKLTVEAQNSLLIALEDPPKNVIMMLLADGSDKILTTIKSRAQYVSTSRFTDDELKEHLLSSDTQAQTMNRADPEGFAMLVRSADGVIGRAKTLLNPREAEQMREEYKTVKDILEALSPKVDYATLYKRLSLLPTKRDQLQRALEMIITGVRDLIILRNSETANLMFFSDRRQARTLGREIGKKRLLLFYDIFDKAHEDNSKNANINSMPIKLAASIKLI